MIFWFCFLFMARMTEGVESSSFKKTSVYRDYLDIQPYPAKGIDCSLFLVRKETCYVGKQCMRGPGYFCVSSIDSLSVEDRERVEEGMGLDKMVEVFQNSSIQEPEFKLKCEIPKNQPYGKFHCYNDSEIERCFLMCKPGYVPKLHTGTYCISNTWSRNIDELQCIPATTIVTVGGYGQV
ncbi:uncharacterized protein LOC111715850 isoform X2 [Eurytemora carolleeae]|uniref:uncharacterized protein LOC111715850 isoform X2 n=1 Tax=Eurytemora carolleeae TaxID=1294199 RepID=UPI000C793AED|nr:uncharacterized protein LOC111715850 isoform X2 [Eurytemora carolleeae]|eukprot:XP_023347009.1 uncharacterized protein LOC111715850 isoform X2 [Eurytemora affinis]